MTKRLTNLVGALALSGAVILGSVGCNTRKDAQILSNYDSTITTRTLEGRGYSQYAHNLQEQYPQIDKMDPREVTRFLETLNDNKELKYPGKIKLPVYSDKK